MRNQQIVLYEKLQWKQHYKFYEDNGENSMRSMMNLLNCVMKLQQHLAIKTLLNLVMYG